MNEVERAIDSGMREIKFTKAMQQRVLEEGRYRKSRKSNRYISVKKMVPAAVCFILCLGIIAAGKVKLWDKYVAQQYNLADNEPVQEKTIADGLADPVLAAAKDNGITVQVLQSVASGSHLQIYLKIQAESEEIADGLVDVNPDFEISYDHCMEFSGGGSMENYYTGEGMKTVFVEERDGQEGPDYEIYSIYSTVGNGELEGDTVHLKIHNFVGNSQTSPDKVVEGDWELSFKVSADTTEKAYVFDKEYSIYGKTLKLHEIKITPTGISILIDKALADGQGLMDGQVYLVSLAGEDFLTDYESAEWRGDWGVPLAVAKAWTPQEKEAVYEQIENGTYQGEYIDFWEWTKDKTHQIVGPWDNIQIKLDDGTQFRPANSSGLISETDDCYVINENYIGYLEMNQVREVQIGDCIIPLSEGAEQ